MEVDAGTATITRTSFPYACRMARFVIAFVLLAFAAVTAGIGVPKVALEHRLMQLAQQVPAVAQGAALSERRGSKNKRYYEARPTFVAQTPEGSVSSAFLDPSLEIKYSTQSRRRRDEWALQYAQGVPLQAWYVPSASLPPDVVSRLGTGTPLVFHEKRYPAGHLVLVGLSTLLAGIGIAVLGSRRGETPKTIAIAGSEPPMREVVGRKRLWPSAIATAVGALVALVPTIGLAVFLIVGATGRVPTGVWWMVGGLGVVSLVLVLMALHNLYLARVFVQPKVMIEHDAIRIGQMNVIALSALCTREPAAPVVLTVMCERLVWVGSGKSRQLKRSTEWSHTLHGHALVTGMGAGGATGAGGAGFAQHDAWQLVVPARVPATRKAKGVEAGYVWTIKLKQKAGSGELALEYPVRAVEGGG